MKNITSKKIEKFRNSALTISATKNVKGGSGSSTTPPQYDPNIGITDVVNG